MRRRSLRILHRGREYWLVDRGRDEGSGARKLSLLEPVGQDDGPDAHPVVSTDAGPCRVIGEWSGGSLRLSEERSDLRAMFEQAVERWLREFRLGRERKGGVPFYALFGATGPLFELTPYHPSGLAVLVFSDHERASRAARRRRGIDAPVPRPARISDLADFLAARAQEGYVGALLDEAAPIFFCVNEEEAPRFLRLDPGEEEREPRRLLLTSEGRWVGWEGEEALFPHFDADLADECMLARLGCVPFHGYREPAHWYHPFARGGGPRILEETDSPGAARAPLAPLFSDGAEAEAYAEEHGLAAEVAEVRDLPAFLEEVARNDATAHVHPGGHRARSATLWLHDGDVFLHSWSGLWRSESGDAFELVP